ncbi:MAG: PD40 domain-containing protein [Planctomycetes bacterium]|nr:PD40 domain-containing protein [Planctomycetota bacterium]
MSADGRYVAFGSFAHNLVPNDTNRKDDIFVRDRMTGVTVRVSVTAFLLEANNASFVGAISSSGRFVAFQSIATNVVPGDTNGTLDVFLHDRDPDGNNVFDEANGTTVRVSLNSSGAEANGPSDAASVSADGRFVAFQSSATNLVLNDANGVSDVFVRDVVAGVTTRVSIRSNGMEGNGDSLAAEISADGRWVTFQSLASNLVLGDTNGITDVFVHDRATGTTTRVSVSSTRAQASALSISPSISANGRVVAFSSLAADLVTGDTNGMLDVFVHDRDADGNGVFDEMGGVATTCGSLTSTGAQATGASSRPSISADGRWIAYLSSAVNIVPGDMNARDDVFVRDRGTNQVWRVSTDTLGVEADGSSSRLAIAPLGRFVAFESLASNLVGNDANGRADVFVHDGSSCVAGNVGNTMGPPVDVLRLNGTTRSVTVGRGLPIELSLSAGPVGPLPARYTVWVWRGLPTNQTDLVASGQTIGCTVNPTPLSPGATPRPFRCVRGGLLASFCAGSNELNNAPSRAPWTLRRTRGYPVPAVFCVQAVIEDTSAGNSNGLSVTNAIVLSVQ